MAIGRGSTRLYYDIKREKNHKTNLLLNTSIYIYSAGSKVKLVQQLTDRDIW